MKLTALMAASIMAVAPAGPSTVISRPLYISSLQAQLQACIVAPGAVVLLGDSIIHDIPNAKAIDPRAVNYGIVGDTTAGIAHRITMYAAIRTASVVVLEGGVNNLPFGLGYDAETAQDFRSTISAIPARTRIIALGAFPVDEAVPKARSGWNARIRTMNESVRRECRSIANCTYLDMGLRLANAYGNLQSFYHHPGDGIHLNDRAYVEVMIPARTDWPVMADIPLLTKCQKCGSRDCTGSNFATPKAAHTRRFWRSDTGASRSGRPWQSSGAIPRSH